jgi:hypothetical protein
VEILNHLEFMLIDVMMILLEDFLFVVLFVCFYFFFVNLSFLKLASVVNEENAFIYRLESDSQTGNLTGVIDFCSELGGYPIYGNNAYEWQLIQGNI